MTNRLKEQFTILFKILGVAAVVLVFAGADGCCDRNGHVHVAGEVNAFELIPDGDSKVKMRVRAGGKVYHLDQILPGIEQGARVDVYKAMSDCSLNVLLCSRRDDGDRAKDCSPVRKIEKVKTKDPENEGLGIPK